MNKNEKQILAAEHVLNDLYTRFCIYKRSGKDEKRAFFDAVRELAIMREREDDYDMPDHWFEYESQPWN